MARALIGSALASPFNPLRITGTALPPNVLLAAKLIVTCLVLKGYKIPEPFVPLLGLVDAIPYPGVLRIVIQLAFWGAALALLLNFRVRTSALLAGIAFLCGHLVARGAYANGNFFCSCILILTGLYEAPYGLRLLRAQFVIMYLGSSLNKLLIADWRTGQYFEHWLHAVRPNDLYIELASALPPMALSTALGWATIGTEAALAVGFAVRVLHRSAIWLALLMHGFSVFLSGWDFGIFFPALLFSMILFVDWPRPGSVTIQPGPGGSRALRRASDLVHFDGLFRWSAPDGSSAPLRLSLDGRGHWGLDGVNRWLLLNPFAYFLAAAFLCATRSPQQDLRIAVFVVGLAWFGLPALANRFRRLPPLPE